MLDELEELLRDGRSFLFGERLSRTQVAGVVLIVAGVTLLAATNA